MPSNSGTPEAKNKFYFEDALPILAVAALGWLFYDGDPVATAGITTTAFLVSINTIALSDRKPKALNLIAKGGPAALLGLLSGIDSGEMAVGGVMSIYACIYTILAHHTHIGAARSKP